MVDLYLTQHTCFICYSWSWLNVCRSHQHCEAWHVSTPGNGCNIASVISRPSTSYQRKCFLAVTTSDTKSKEKKKSLLFSLRLIIVVRASQCVSVCHSSFLWCRYDNGVRSEGPFKSEKSASGTKSSESHGESNGLEISVLWKQDRRKVDIYVEGKKKWGKTAAHHWSKHSVTSTTGRLIRSALPVTALRNTSAWREVRPETVSTLQPPPSPAGRKKWHQQPVNSHPLWLKEML